MISFKGSIKLSKSKGVFLVTDKIMEIAMNLVSSAGMYGAVTAVNFGCAVLLYQGKEPASVRKLRKF